MADKKDGDGKIIRLHPTAPDKPLMAPTPCKVDDGDSSVWFQQTEEEIGFLDAIAARGVEYDLRYNTYTITDPMTGVKVDYNRTKLIKILCLRDPSFKDPDKYQTILEAYEEKTRHDARVKLIKLLSPVDREKGKVELDKFVNILCREGHEESAVILEQWIWLVRNKLHRKPGDSHVVPVLSGKQGSGKSKAIRALLGPVEDFATRKDFSQILDSRETNNFEKSLIVHIEEMAGGKRGDIDKLKALVTSESLDMRPMYTNDQIKLRMSTSFIGDTNRQLKEVIQDSSGARRWWELRCRDAIDEQALLNIDYHAIWRCVHEDDPKPVTRDPEIFRRIDRGQTINLTALDSYGQWLLSSQLEPGKHLVGDEYLFDHYLAFCKDNGLMARRERGKFRDFLKSKKFEKKAQADIRHFLENKNKGKIERFQRLAFYCSGLPL